MKSYHFLITLLACLISYFGIGQNITIYNINSLEPVQEVFIIDHQNTNTVISDSKGMADVSVFNESDTLLFQHPSFYRKIVPLGDIKKALNTVYLSEAAVDLGEFKVMANKRQQLETELPMMVVPISKKEIQFN